VKPRFFRTSAELRAWFEKNHAKAPEIYVAFNKKGTGKGGVDYAQALDEALCFGWIDGVRQGGEASWSIRFTPRRKGSYWSAVNLRHAERLIAAGRMTAAGLAEYEKRDRSEQQRYAYENRPQELTREQQARFRASPRAWAFFAAQAPSFRRAASWWVLSAKKEETRERRLAELIECAARGKKPRALVPPGRAKDG
jgi:uncharacterized protein YdeI (YjbR/CyaY-like superfamily)